MERPTIDYPCQWRYRLIGTDAGQLRAVIAEVFADRSHDVTHGNVSSRGTWCSLEVAAEVRSEADRDERFQALAAAEGVHTVM